MAKRALYDCEKCPAFCCSVYERVAANNHDIVRLARHFGVDPEVARQRYTKELDGETVLRRKRDPILGETCMFLDANTRGCTIYHARPGTCRQYPTTRRCAYWDLMLFERKQQGDETVVPRVSIYFIEDAAE